MHGLNRFSRATNNPVFNTWAIELAKTAHAAFVYASGTGIGRMYWKMSIDLSRPLVHAMGHHDPLDGLITYKQLRKTSIECFDETQPNLDAEIAHLEDLCRGVDWTTDDPLGIGGLLTDVCRVVQLIREDGSDWNDLLTDLLKASLAGLESYRGSEQLTHPARYRLAFRELGMSIGLHAAQKARGLIEKTGLRFPREYPIPSQLRKLDALISLGETIENFWLQPEHRQSETWLKHKDINSVMLATSLVPGGYLDW
jgi:hypothetical protein